MSTSPNLSLPYLDANQNQKSVTHNQALRMLDALVQLAVQSSDLASPPAAPTDGQRWIVAPGGTGAWAGRDLSIAAWQDGAWSFFAPNGGMLAFDAGQNTLSVWTGSAWTPLPALLKRLAVQALGIGTAPDGANPLSATLNDALFSALPGGAAGGSGDVRVKLNKSAASNTASFLFQDGFAGRAEIGLAGDDNFHFRVSPDGSTFYDALVVAAAGGGASFLLTPSAPTAPTGDSSTKLATTAFVAGAVAGATGPQGAASTVAGPAGATGARGPAGPTGPAGSPGPVGATGVPGATGPQGAAGAQGPTGPQGPAGTVGASGPTGGNGAQGATGAPGPTGPQGAASSAPGPTGPIGLPGVTGPQGPAGPASTKGDPGSSGPTGPTGASGAVGPQGPTGFGGAAGPTGSQGPAGASGAGGAAGLQGPAGLTGPTGAAGPQGSAGVAGSTGPQGSTGATGAQGATGPQGPAGFARTQVNDAAYAALATDRTVAVIALTAARTVTLPAAGAYPAGAVLTVVDESGACSATNTVTVAAAGGDKVNGAASAMIAAPYGYIALQANTSTKWTVVDAPAPVTAVAGRTGAVALAVADVSGAAPLASPALTGTPTAPNAPVGTNTAQVATTSFVAASFVTYGYASANYATAANATLTGTPTAPTQGQNDGSTRLATTAYADRAAAAGNLSRAQVSDVAYAVQASDRVVAVVALTAARTVTLPAASAFPQGATLTVVDESGACSAANAVTVVRASSSDAVNGGAGAALTQPYGYLALQSNGSNKWTVIDQSLIPNRRTFTDVAKSANQAVGSSFTRIAMGTVNQDVGGNWDSTNNWYVCPRAGVYLITGTIRVADGTAAGSTYSCGVYTAEQDGPWHLWTAVGPGPATRSTYAYSRLSFQGAGDRLRMFAYSDASGGVTVISAGLQIALVSDAV